MTRHNVLSSRRTLAPVALALALLSLNASASDGGIPDVAVRKPLSPDLRGTYGGDDAPRIVQLSQGTYLFNKPAFDKVDGEMKRLQGVEREHKAESWGLVLVVGLSVGLLVGVPTGLLLSEVFK
jgi:hypothetical protein